MLVNKFYGYFFVFKKLVLLLSGDFDFIDVIDLISINIGLLSIIFCERK